jgi:DNA-binding transcriptional LysR family regulator
MELLQLEHFLAVAEEGSFTRAAARVRRTQSAVSQNVKKLEEAIGVPLFARDMPELSLTEAGRAIVDRARRILALREDAIRQVGELRILSSGNLTIAAHESAALYLLPAPLRRYFERFPRIKVGIHRRRLDEIPRQVMDREFDIGFVKDEPAFPELRSILVYSDDMILIASPRHPLAAWPKLQVKDLGSESFMVHHLCVATEQKIRRFFESHGTHCNIAAELWSFESIKHFVQQDVGLAFVPRITVLHELSAGTLVGLPLEGLDMARRIFMVYRSSGYISDSAQQFIDVMGSSRWDDCLPRPRPPVPQRRAVLRAVRQGRGPASYNARGIMR